MERIVRLRPAVAPSLAILAALGLAGLLTLSLAIQPPHDAGADPLQRTLGWARAALFTAGALAFLIGLVVSMRGGGSPQEPGLLSRTPATPQARRAAFTVVAFGRTPEDTRAIADAQDGAEALRLLRAWSEEYPDETIVVFDADAEPIVFKRSVRGAHLARRGAA